MEERKETEAIRAWYERTTAVARRSLLVATAVSVPGGTWFFLAVPLPVMALVQTFNGAITIPISAAIWVAAFIFLFLLPSREASFRSVESVERTETMVRDAIKTEIPKLWERDVKPVLSVWEELGNRLKARFDEESVERILRGLESMVGTPAGNGSPDPSAGLRAFHRARQSKESST